MGLTKQYLAYKPVDTFNIITSGRANVNFASYNRIEGRYVVSAAAENVILWDLRLGERVLALRRDKQEVTAIRVSPDHMHIAVGYIDGVVEIFELSTSQSVCSLALHKSAISILRYDEIGLRLVCGSLDTDLVIVDVVEQAGRQRLIGHNAPITDAHFLERLGIVQNVVVSASKDTQIKFWNLETQFCFKTIVDNRTEVWALAFVGSLMIAGSSESGMNVYRLKERFPDELTMKNIESAVEGLSIDDEDTISPLTVINYGIIQRAGKGRTVSLVADPTERVISCHGTNDIIESFYICTDEEAKQRLSKRLKKARKSMGVASTNEDDSSSKELSLSDEIRRLEIIKVKQKIKSIDILLGGKHELRILTSLANNCLQLYSLDTCAKKQNRDEGIEAVKCLSTLARLGHQSEVRAVCFSSDSLAIGTGAAESFKLWNREALQCLRTVPTDYILCSTFVPGDRYVLLGMKTGKLLIVDVGIGEIVEEIPAHESELWSITLLPDQKGCMTGSGDTTVKLWIFELIDCPVEIESESEQRTGKVLSLLHKNTLKLQETVLCVRISPNMKYLAVGLLDSTVKVFFLDTFKFYLSLYGHKLPVLCMDISYDSTLIATGSADRNVKIWGLDFGDCHRSLFAHDDSVMGLQFINNTHMFFTCGKDGRIKQWDGDSFEKIITLPGHIGEAYSLSVSPNGRYLVTCGSDRTLRLFQRTEEILVLEDVREEELEEMENQELATGEDNSVPMLPNLKLASRKTVGAEKGAESILECLEICRQRQADNDDNTKQDLHPLMLALEVDNVNDFLLTVIARIRSSDLEESLLILPFTNVCELLERLPPIVLQRNDEIELLCKVTIFLFKVHMKPITSTRTLRPLLDRLVKLLRNDIHALRNVMGANLHGLALWQHELEARDGMELFYEVTQERKKRDKKRREATKRLHIQMTSF